MCTAAVVRAVEPNMPLFVVSVLVGAAAIVCLLALELVDRWPRQLRRELQWIALGVALFCGGLAYGATTVFANVTVKHESAASDQEPMRL